MLLPPNSRLGWGREGEGLEGQPVPGGLPTKHNGNSVTLRERERERERARGWGEAWGQSGVRSSQRGCCPEEGQGDGRLPSSAPTLEC